jgi:dCMP deaminase
VTFTRPSWEEYFLDLARVAATRADCTRRQVGAVLVRPDHTVASIGYNGAPRSEPGCGTENACPRGRVDYQTVTAGSSYDTGLGACIALHAEQNAMAFCRENSTGYTLYVTCQPCDGCWRMLKAYNLKDVIWDAPLA